MEKSGMRDKILTLISAAVLLLALAAHLAVAPAEKPRPANQPGEFSSGGVIGPAPAAVLETVLKNRADRNSPAPYHFQQAPSTSHGDWRRSPGLGSHWNQYTR